MTHALPYKKVVKLMVIALVAGATKWINAFPPTNGVSKTMSPAMIVQGLSKPNLRYKRIVYGSYALVYMGTRNDMIARSIPVIALNPSKEHGGNYFMSLYSGKMLHSYEWAELPIDDEVISRVEELATHENAATMVNGYPVFTWMKRNLEYMNIETEEYDQREDDSESVIIGDVVVEHDHEIIELIDEGVNYITDKEQTEADSYKDCSIEEDEYNIVDNSGIEEDNIMSENVQQEIAESIEEVLEDVNV
jgi:hypothetical protein